MSRTGPLGQIVGAAALVSVVAVSTWQFWPARGTDDVDAFWLQWVANSMQAGPIRGYVATQSDYPPGASLILWMVGVAAGRTGVDPRVLIKVLLFGVLVASTAIVYWGSRRALLAAGSHAAFALSAVALMYLDILIVPFVFAAIWALRRGRGALALVLFACACLFKWQPLFVLPFAAIAFAGRRHELDARAWRAEWIGASVTIAAIVAAVLGTYGRAVTDALYAASRHAHLSNDALNLPWVLSWWLEKTDPAHYSGLSPGGIVTILNVSRRMLRTWAWISVAAYGVAVWAYWRSRDRSVTALLRYAIVGYLAYFTLCSGVHENHLFLASLLAIAFA